MEPEVELHPVAAAERGISPGDWVRVETPEGSMRARARLNEVGGQAVLGRQDPTSTPWLTERHGYDPT